MWNLQAPCFVLPGTGYCDYHSKTRCRRDVCLHAVCRLASCTNLSAGLHAHVVQHMCSNSPTCLTTASTSRSHHRKQLQWLLRKGCKTIASKETTLQRLLDATPSFVAGTSTVGDVMDRHLLCGVLNYISGVRTSLDKSTAACAKMLQTLGY